MAGWYWGDRKHRCLECNTKILKGQIHTCLVGIFVVDVPCIKSVEKDCDEVSWAYEAFYSYGCNDNNEGEGE